MANCLQYAEQRTQSCTQYADQGYSSCSAWDARCCTWWPCSWLCKLVTWVCLGWYWVANVVCVLWTIVTTLVCAVWEVVVTIVSFVVTLVEALLGWVLSYLALVFELIFAIPYVGRILQWIWNVIILNLVWLAANLIDAALYLVGVRPQKKLRICTIILRDEKGNPVAAVDDVVDMINDAIDPLLRECNVQILNSAPLQLSSGLSFDSVRADRSWIQIDGRPGSTALLDTACDEPAFGDDLSNVGPEYQIKGATSCFFGNWRNVVGLGTPVTVLVVRSIARPTVFSGCCIWVSNYLTLSAAFIPNGRPNATLAHELGHSCNLFHLTDPTNLMDVTSPGPSGSMLRFWQELLIRASRHVSYV